jgi:tetratricopeptide (TPR) repeat protein
MEGYLAQGSPGREPPEGHGEWGARVYCPQCGALVAENALRPNDYDDHWVWFRGNAAANEGDPDPPLTLLFGWQRIPQQFVPMYEEHELNIEAVHEFEREHPEGSAAEPPASGPWSEAWEQLETARRAGDCRAAAAALEQAIALGLPAELHADGACALALDELSAGDDLDEVFRRCRESIEASPTRCWQAYSLLSMIHAARNNTDAALREYDSARRYARTKWWVPEVEQRLVDTANRLAVDD